MLGKLSILQAWVGLHFSVLTQRVLHNGKILQKFFYDFFFVICNAFFYLFEVGGG